jgi:hypothetical protein
MPLVGFEPTISVFDRAKAFRASDCEAAMIGVSRYNLFIDILFLYFLPPFPFIPYVSSYFIVVYS